MKTLIISDYDCGHNCTTCVYENGVLKYVDECINFDVVSELDSFIFEGGVWEKPYDEYNRAAQEKAKELLDKYDDIVLCRDGECTNARRFK